MFVLGLELKLEPQRQLEQLEQLEWLSQLVVMYTRWLVE
jgi:hypothetical protein